MLGREQARTAGTTSGRNLGKQESGSGLEEMKLVMAQGGDKAAERRYGVKVMDYG